MTYQNTCTIMYTDIRMSTLQVSTSRDNKYQNTQSKTDRTSLSFTNLIINLPLI